MEGHSQSESQAASDGGLAHITSEIGVFRHLEDLAERSGFACFALITLPVSSQERLEENVLASNWPPEFLRAYDDMRPFREVPLFARLRVTSAPVAWTLGEGENQPTVRSSEARRLFQHQNYRSGLALPVGSPDGARAVVFLAGDRPPLDREELAELVLSVTYAYDRYCRLKHEPETTPAKLSERELQVLGWAANGKTSAEIATILSLSDHTVNSYLNSAMRKLDCVNRTQLVAKALRLRLIS